MLLGIGLEMKSRISKFFQFIAQLRHFVFDRIAMNADCEGPFHPWLDMILDFRVAESFGKHE